jgi:hypothetical protein
LGQKKQKKKIEKTKKTKQQQLSYLHSIIAQTPIAKVVFLEVS